MIVAAQKAKSERSYAEKNEICDWSAAGGAYGGGCGTGSWGRVRSSWGQLQQLTHVHPAAGGPPAREGTPPAWGKTRETTPAWLVGGHNAKILNLKTGQLPSLEVVQGMQSASKQSGGVLVPSTQRPAEWFWPSSLAANFWPTIKLSEEPFRCTGPMMREERGGCRL